MLYLTGQKRGMSELNLVWPVILTGIHAAVISSPAAPPKHDGMFAKFLPARKFRVALGKVAQRQISTAK